MQIVDQYIFVYFHVFILYVYFSHFTFLLLIVCTHGDCECYFEDDCFSL